jgi:hypothetical protein
MPINSNIALGVQPLQLADPLASYSKVAAIQGAQQQNELARLQMQEYERARSEDEAIRNRLAGGASLDDPSTRNFLLGSKSGRDILQRQSDLQKANTEEAARRAKLMQDTQAMYRDLSGQIGSKQDAAAFLQRMVNDPALKDSPIARIPLMQQIQRIPEDADGLKSWIQQFSLGATKYITENKPTTQVIDQSGQRQVVQFPGLGGAPTTVGTYADVPLPAAVVAQKKEIARASAPTITNVQEKAEAGERGKMLVNQYGDISKAAGLAARTLPSIEANLNLLNKGFDTGFGKETVAAGASVLAALGVKDAEKFATDTQKFQSNAITAVLQKQLEQKGPQTESDARRIEQIGAQLGKTKSANEFILSMAREQLRRDVDQRNFYDRWYKTNKTYDGAEDAWFSGEGGKSLFDRPALKKYGTSNVDQIPTSATPPRVAPATAPNIDALVKKYGG